MVEAVWELPIRLPRNAFSPREVARAGDIGRALQDVAVEASTRAGWPPSRYGELGTSFLVRSVTVLHHRETCYGEALLARTWVSRLRRETLCTREVRLRDQDGPVASATQEWVHITADLKPTRASAELVACFSEHAGEPSVELPTWTRVEAEPTVFELECWNTWMDPLGHVNHPVYVDWAEECIARLARARGVDPSLVVPVFDHAVYKQGIVAGDRVRIVTTMIGALDTGAPVFSHRIFRREGVVAADLTTARTLVGHPAVELCARLSGSETR